MEKLKELFGEDALTFSQLEEKLKDNKEVKLANLAAGHYVDKKKFEAQAIELSTAQETIKGLKDTVSKFDGVDVDGLKKAATDWETKYNEGIAAAKLDNALTLALVEAKVKNPKLARAGLDMSVIKLDGDNIIGLSEQLDKLKETDGYLFDTVDEGARVNTGASHANTNNTDVFMSALMKGAGLEQN